MIATPLLGAAPGSAAGAAALLDRPIGLVLVFGLVSMLPLVFMTLTAFVKISTVLQIVRGAIGAHGVPSSSVVFALSVALTLLAMGPLGATILDRATPLFTQGEKDTVSLVRGLADATVEPMRAFLRRNASERDRSRFFEIAKTSRPEAERASVQADDLVVLIPAFVTSELGLAFALGFALYLPFLVINLVVGNVLIALGMQMLNPAQVSLPFKLLLFVAVDGWGMLSQALVAGYQAG